MARFWIQGLLQRAVGLRGRVARARGRPARARGPLGAPGNRGGGAARAPERGDACRRRLAGAGAAALLYFGLGAAQAADLIATRIWPARDYTRVTFESRQALDYSMFALKDPGRLVLDLVGADAGPALAELQNKV